MADDKRKAYVAVVREDGYFLGIAVEGESGYHPMKEGSDHAGDWGDYERVREAAEDLNERLGLSKVDAAIIVASTMRKDA